jgi:hypothetical protein
MVLEGDEGAPHGVGGGGICMPRVSGVLVTTVCQGSSNRNENTNKKDTKKLPHTFSLKESKRGIPVQIKLPY